MRHPGEVRDRIGERLELFAGLGSGAFGLYFFSDVPVEHGDTAVLRGIGVDLGPQPARRHVLHEVYGDAVCHHALVGGAILEPDIRSIHKHVPEDPPDTVLGLDLGQALMVGIDADNPEVGIERKKCIGHAFQDVDHAFVRFRDGPLAAPELGDIHERHHHTRDCLAHRPVGGNLHHEMLAAYTSAMFRAKGTTLQRQPRHAPLAEAGAHLVFAAGSVPIAAGGVFYGAVGVSGTPDATLDEYCAGRGVAAVQEALEMQ